MLEFKNTLQGERLVLKRTEPTIEIAESIFKVMDANREYLKMRFPWLKFILKVEDELKYLFQTEEKTKLGEKIEYGLYLDNNYIGNIGVFDIKKKAKSAEISYWLANDFTRNGYMIEAINVIETYFFYELGLNRIQIHCDKKNVASIKLAEKANYYLE